MHIVFPSVLQEGMEHSWHRSQKDLVAATTDTASAATSFLKSQVNEDGSYDSWSSWEGNTSSYRGYGQLIDALLAFKATGEENSTEAKAGLAYLLNPCHRQELATPTPPTVQSLAQRASSSWVSMPTALRTPLSGIPTW